MLPSRCKWDIRSSGKFRGVNCWLSTFRNYLSIPYSSVKRSKNNSRTAWFFKAGSLYCPEMLVFNYQSLLLNIPEERRSQFASIRWGVLKDGGVRLLRNVGIKLHFVASLNVFYNIWLYSFTWVPKCVLIFNWWISRCECVLLAFRRKLLCPLSASKLAWRGIVLHRNGDRDLAKEHKMNFLSESCAGRRESHREQILTKRQPKPTRQ